MKTTINNQHRVFMIKVNADNGGIETYFCNLLDIPNVIKELKQGERFSIYEFWDAKMKLVTKSFINEMFVANQINYKLKTFIKQ